MALSATVRRTKHGAPTVVPGKPQHGSCGKLFAARLCTAT